MAFQLNSVVPWGRNIDEYREMFLLSDDDMKMNIAGFGDGPASFNYQATLAGSKVTSFDPIYQFTREQLEQRIEEVRTIVMKQMMLSDCCWMDVFQNIHQLPVSPKYIKFLKRIWYLY